MVVLLLFDKVFLRFLQPYLSVMLNKGSLEVLVFTGHHNPRRIIRRPEQGALNDGREHSLRIERLPGRLVFCVLVYANILGCCWLIKLFVCVWLRGLLSVRSFAVQVDEEAKKESALPNNQPVSLQHIFLGGIPAEVEQTSNRVNVPFQGCIWNLMINNVWVTSSLYSLPFCLHMRGLL